MIPDAEAVCGRCGKSVKQEKLFPLPEHLLNADEKSDFFAKNSKWLCRDCLTQTRRELISRMIGEQQDVKELEAHVVQSIVDHQLVSVAPEDEAEAVSWPDRLSDNIAKFGGSWRFIVSFMVFMLIWICLNSLTLLWKPFDPYPFILLNLALSCLAALQAPVIMMSQNRQETRDRQRNINDYQVNLKAELEIRQLHLKLDQLLYRQWQQLYTLQELQIEMLEELLERETDPELNLD